MKIRLHLKIFIFIAIFIVTRQIKIYSLVMLFALLHEIGHIIAGIVLGFKPTNLEIMPFGFSISFAPKIDDYNKKIKKGYEVNLKKMLIALAGPLTNIIFIIIFSICNIKILNIQRDILIYSNILITLFNLIPIYPLDGGRIIKEIIHIIWGSKNAIECSNIISKTSIIILTAISSIALLYLKNIAIVLILTYLWYLVITENKKYSKKKKIYDKLNNYNEIEAVIK